MQVYAERERSNRPPALKLPSLDGLIRDFSSLVDGAVKIGCEVIKVGSVVVTAPFKLLSSSSSETKAITESASTVSMHGHLLALNERYSKAERALQQPNLRYEQVPVQVAELKLLLVECSAAAPAIPPGDNPWLDLLKLAQKIVRCLLGVSKVVGTSFPHPNLLATIGALENVDAILATVIKSAEANGKRMQRDNVVAILEVIGILADILMLRQQDEDSSTVQSLMLRIRKTQAALLGIGVEKDSSLGALTPELQKLGRFLDEMIKFFEKRYRA